MAAASSSSEVRVASRRIVDYLNDGEELGAEGAVETPPCTPAAAVVMAGEAARSVLPRFRWPRLVRRGRKGGGAGKAKEKEEEVAVVAEKRECGDLPVAAAVSPSVCQSEPASDKRHSDLGVGLSLVFLLAKTSDEFNKMVKVRTEMEALLKEIKDEVRNKDHDDAPKARNRESTTSSCVTDGNDQSVSARLEYQAASSGVEPASYEKSFEDGGCCAMMDVLEEELQAEMEMLKVNYGSETPSLLPEEEEEHYSEVCDPLTDRIEELEAALRCAEKKLVEKEMEVSLWKDTAKYALRHDNEMQ
nr:unnamed protein product [Digitaria exilis]